MLPVAFDNQGGLASTEQRGELPVCSVASVQELSYFSIVTVMFPLLFLKQKYHVVGKVGVDLCDWLNPSLGLQARPTLLPSGSCEGLGFRGSSEWMVAEMGHLAHS